MKQASYEQALTKEGVEWEYLDKVPIDQINITRGKSMQARLDPIDPTLVDYYAKMIIGGSVPPPIILWKPGRGLYIPLDGNQRLAANSQIAAKYKLKEMSAYLVKTEDPMIADRICWSFNNLVNGRRLSYEECIEHALVFSRKYKYSVEKSSKMWSVKAWDLQSRVIEADMTDLANANKIHWPNTISAKVLVVLSPLRKIGEDVAIKAVAAAAENGITVEEAQGLVKKVKMATTAEKRIAVVDEFASSDAIKARRAQTASGKYAAAKKLPREVLQKQLDSLDELLKAIDNQSAFKPVGKDDKQEYFDTALRVCNSLISVYGLGSLLTGQGGQ